MKDLERARVHLLAAQNSLREARRYGFNDPSGWEDMFLAALSWVWEEQEKSRLEFECWFGP